jgi:hypothetical protein
MPDDYDIQTLLLIFVRVNLDIQTVSLSLYVDGRLSVL